MAPRLAGIELTHSRRADDAVAGWIVDAAFRAGMDHRHDAAAALTDTGAPLTFAACRCMAYPLRRD